MNTNELNVMNILYEVIDINNKQYIKQIVKNICPIIFYRLSFDSSKYLNHLYGN